MISRKASAAGKASLYALITTFSLSVPLARATPAQNQPGADARLEGSWLVVGGEHEEAPLDAIKGGTMVITGRRFEIHTASGKILKGELRFDRDRHPARMDLVHDDTTKWEAIYEVTGDEFRLNYIEAGGKDVRPTTFTTSKTTEASLVVLRRPAK